MAARHLIEPHADRPQKDTLSGDKGFDTQDFVAELRKINVTAHVAQNTNGRRSAIDGRTTRHAGYAISLRIRKRIEEAFGWAKTVAGPACPASAPTPAVSLERRFSRTDRGSFENKVVRQQAFTLG